MIYAINYRIEDEWKHIVIDSPQTVLELSNNIDLYGNDEWLEYEIIEIQKH